MDNATIAWHFTGHKQDPGFFTEKILSSDSEKRSENCCQDEWTVAFLLVAATRACLPHLISPCLLKILGFDKNVQGGPRVPLSFAAAADDLVLLVVSVHSPVAITILDRSMFLSCRPYLFP